MRRFPAIVALMLATATAAAAAGLDAARLFPGAVFAPGVPTVEQATGVRPGARPLRHAELLDYLHRLAAASPRARVVEYARSFEDRPLVYLAVSDEATIARLDAFRAEHARRMDPRSGTAADVVTGTKAVAWMAYGIHGDELSSTDAAAALAWRLVAGEDAWAREVRRDLVVLIDPCENPDGRERFLAMTTAFAHRQPNPDGEDLSHTAVWPWGRGNHYLFDLNRDWISMVHPESARSGVIAAWNPQLMVDSHEMGPDDTYLFSPPRHPFNPFLPTRLRAWWDRFAADQAGALDGRGYAYYTREWNEEFFPGYGSIWASYLGAVGILYEMSSTEGTLVRQRTGTERTFAQAVEHQLTSSIANIDTLARQRAELLESYLEARREAIRRGSAGPVRAWLLAPGSDPERADGLARRLRRQGIEVARTTEAVPASGLRDARTGKTPAADLPAGAWVIPMDQPAGLLARVILDPHVSMDAAFLREEREHLERGKGTRLYDTTAWSMPLLHGVPFYWTDRKPSASVSSEDPPEPEGKVTGPAAAFAWVLDGAGDRSIRALARLLEGGIAARLAEKPFRAAGRGFGRGAVLVKREGNPADTPARLAAVARETGVEFVATPTAKAEEGPDLGGQSYHPLVPPRAAVLTGSPVAPGAYGALWHLLDRTVGMRFTGLDAGRINQADLSRFNVIVFPPAFGGVEAYRSLLGDPGLDRLRRWIEAGGTAIGIGSGAEFLADKDVKLTRTRLRRQALDRFPPVVVGAAAAEAEAGGAYRAAGVRAVEPPAKDAPATEPRPTVSTYDVAPWLGPGARPFAPEAPKASPLEPVSLATWIKPLLPPGKERPDPDDLERADARLRRFAPRGVIVRAELDPNVWLNWGMPAELDVWLDASDTLVAEPPVQVAARFAGLDDLHLGGLLWPEAAGRLAKTAYCAREGLGRGQVILFLDEPAYRGWALGTSRLFLHAVLYGPGMGTQWSAPW
jgi:hypothetical protein